MVFSFQTLLLYMQAHLVAYGTPAAEPSAWDVLMEVMNDGEDETTN